MGDRRTEAYMGGLQMKYYNTIYDSSIIFFNTLSDFRCGTYYDLLKPFVVVFSVT